MILTKHIQNVNAIAYKLRPAWIKAINHRLKNARKKKPKEKKL